MEEVTNITREELESVLTEFNYRPRLRDVIVTVNTVEGYDSQGAILSENLFSDEQFVVAVGPHVTDIEPGDEVVLDLEKMTIKESNPENVYESISKLRFFPIYFKDRAFALISDNVIKLIKE